ASPQARTDAERTTVEVIAGKCEERPVAPGTRFDVRTRTMGLRRGDRVAFSGRFAPVTLFDNPGVLPAWVRLARTGTALSGHADTIEILAREGSLVSTIDAARAHVRSRIRATYHGEAESLGRALVLGE